MWISFFPSILLKNVLKGLPMLLDKAKLDKESICDLIMLSLKTLLGEAI